MKPTMMSFPMSVQMIMRHGARIHASSTIATFDGKGFSQASYAELAENAARLAAGLAAIGVRPGDRIGSFCWNHRQHFEAYLAVPSMGAVLHTLNIRLFPEQIVYIANHAQDRMLIADAQLLPQLEEVLPQLPKLEALIVVGGDGSDSGFLGRIFAYDDLVASHAPITVWPELDEDNAAVVCYTSGTTGNPKGVVYSHKSIFVHSLASMGVDTFAVSQQDNILLLPSMFHSNAWGLPFSGWFAGSNFLLPGPHLQPDKIRTMVESGRPTFTALVPTLLNDLLRTHQVEPVDMQSFRVIVAGGSAISPALISRVKETWGVDVIQGWGMTETSPLCTLSVPPTGVAPADEPQWRSKSGRPVPGMEVRIRDVEGNPVPNDGVSVGALELRGPWVAKGYHDNEENVVTPDGWLKTGDVGTIDSRGYVQVTDRVKDMIKSGGEWISSVELENLLARHPAIAEVAVVAITDPRWEERPLAVIVPVGENAPCPAELRAYLAQDVAKFWLPEYWATIAELPKTSVGKIDKKALRQSVLTGDIDYVRDDRLT